ncbi:MAG: glycosyltransferase family 2 protein [Acidimicrobiia bacterium]
MAADRENRQATIGVICCAYQAEDHIDQMLASLASQTRLADQVVVVDDASTDGTGDRARAWADHLPITVVRASENLGPGAARHLAVGHLTTDLISPIDADDVVLPDHLDALARYLPEGLGAVGSAGYYWHPGQPLVNFHERSRLGLAPEHQLRQLLVTNRLLIAGMYRRCDYDAIGGFEDMAHEDWGLWVKLAMAGIPITICPVPTYLYRQHAASLTGNDERRSVLDVSAFEQLIARAKDHLPVDEIDQIRADRARFLARLEVQRRLTSGDIAGAKAIAGSVSARGDRTMWAIAHLPAPMIRTARSLKNMNIAGRR